MNGTLSLESTEMHDPYAEYIRYALLHKTIHPDDPFPEIPSHLIRSRQPLPSMMNEAKEVLNRIKDLFPLEAATILNVKDIESYL